MPYALTNFVERKLETVDSPVYAADLRGEAFAQCLRELRPKAVIIFGSNGQWNVTARRIAREAGVDNNRIVDSIHPAYPKDYYILMVEMQQAWAEFLRALRS